MVIKYCACDKKNRHVKLCSDFQNLNLTTSKDECVMLVADMLIDVASNHKFFTFMDEYSGYNQIFIIESNLHKTTFGA